MLGMDEPSPIAMESAKLDNGTTVEANAFVAGEEISIVTEDGKVPLPAGEYMLEDGRALIISEDGLIGEVREASAPEAEEPAAEVEASDDAQAAPSAAAKKIIETQSTSKETVFSAAEVALLQGEIETLKLQLAAMQEKQAVKVEAAKQDEAPSAPSFKHSPEKEVEKTKNFNYQPLKKRGTIDRVMSMIAE